MIGQLQKGLLVTRDGRPHSPCILEELRCLFMRMETLCLLVDLMVLLAFIHCLKTV